MQWKPRRVRHRAIPSRSRLVVSPNRLLTRHTLKKLPLELPNYIICVTGMTYLLVIINLPGGLGFLGVCCAAASADARGLSDNNKRHNTRRPTL